ncbi:MAG: carboxypeptidase-like regulatory domain-containing protein [Euryarchaeota archaeon]|nr:carboxypeptidase-like regulatory domain-containing protein [Euryarchaeota archaeon]
MNKDDLKNIVIAVVSVLVVLLIAGALFMMSDLGNVLAFVFISLPIIGIIVVVWYIKSVKQRRLEDPASRVKERELRGICKNMIQLRGRMHDIDGAHSITIAESITDIDSIECTIQNSGGHIDPDSGSVDCDQDAIKGVTLFAIRNIAQDLDRTKQQFIERLYDAAVKYAEDSRTKLGTLNNAGYDLGAYISELESVTCPDKDIDEIVSYLDRLKAITEDALRGCVDDAKKLAEYHTGEVSAEQVEDALQALDYGGAVTRLEEDITTLKTATKEEFQTYRTTLISALDTAAGSVEDEKFKEFKKDVLGMSSPEKLVRLNEIGEAFMKRCQTLVDHMHYELSSTEDGIKEFIPPDYFWSASELAEKDYTLDADSVEDVAGLFAAMVCELHPALERNRRSYKILNSYHRTVERQIQKKLSAKSTVSGDDLKVGHPDEFLRLYDYYHPDASYTDGALRLAEGAKVVENPLTIRVTDEDGTGIGDAGVTLMRGVGISITLEHKTGEDGSVTIENPGEGKYKLTVDAAQYRKHEGTAALPADSIDIILKRKGIEDYLCRGKAKSIKDNLHRYATDVLKELDKSGVVSSEFDMYINKDYRACLLYLLAEEYPNLRFVPHSRTSEYPVLYDEERMVSRLIDATKAMDKESYTASDFDIPLKEEEILHLTEIASERGVHIAVEKDDTA